jgi:hypothetical protein
MNIVAGTLTGLVSFDVGYEFALDALVRLLAPEGGRRGPESARAGIRGAGRTVDIEIFEILNRRAATYRAEALEMTIIILIALEILLSFLR